MISVTQFKKYAFKIFALADKDGFEFHVKQRTTHKVYLVSITITNLPYPTRQWVMARRRQAKRGKVDMPIQSCPICNNPMIAGICVIKTCATNQPKDEKPVS